MTVCPGRRNRQGTDSSLQEGIHRTRKAGEGHNIAHEYPRKSRCIFA